MIRVRLLPAEDVARPLVLRIALATALALGAVSGSSAAECSLACTACCALGEQTSNPEAGVDPDAAVAIVNCIDNKTFTAGKHSSAERARIVGRDGLAASWDKADGATIEQKLQGFSRLYFGVRAVPLANAEPLTHARLLCKALWNSTERTKTELEALR